MTIVNADIGVIQKRRKAGFCAPRTIAAADAFAMRIARSYLPSELTISRAELALAYGASDQINTSHTTRVEISPSISIQDYFSLGGAPKETLGVQRKARRFGEADAAALFERLLSRRKREAAFASGAPSDLREKRYLTPDLPVAQTERLERIVRLPAAPQEAESIAPRGKPITPLTANVDSGWGSPITVPATPKPFTLPPGEVKRVTDEVIREIDHRIIARRERMGRR